ncbi:MAG: hypothetical protein NTW87_22920 [Planctomycetota bacterium]|nr:hypothetical protein [Planctomycetota bacterium]
MPVETWTQEDTAKAKAIWAEYQKKHDVSARKGQTAGIDPVSGRVWFGERIANIVSQLDAEGVTALLYFVRVGYDYYDRKGGHR